MRAHDQSSTLSQHFAQFFPLFNPAICALLSRNSLIHFSTILLYHSPIRSRPTTSVASRTHARGWGYSLIHLPTYIQKCRRTGNRWHTTGRRQQDGLFQHRENSHRLGAATGRNQLPKDERDEATDEGWWVGNWNVKGKRSICSVSFLQILDLWCCKGRRIGRICLWGIFCFKMSRRLIAMICYFLWGRNMWRDLQGICLNLRWVASSVVAVW